MTLDTSTGVLRNYGPIDLVTAPKDQGDGAFQYLRVPFKFNQLPNTATIAAIHASIPPGSVITSAMLGVKTAFTSTSGTTTLNIGTRKKDGTAINATLFFSAKTVASMTAQHVAMSSLTPVSSGLENAYITITPSANDLTAGEATLIIEYAENVTASVN